MTDGQTELQRQVERAREIPLCKTTPWRHQVDAYWFAHAKPGAMLAMDMGTAKSKIAIDLVVNDGARRVLVLTPKSVMPVWRREFALHAAMPLRVVVLDNGQSTKRKEQTARQVVNAAVGPVAVVVNYETAWREPFRTWSLSVPWDCVICDESQKIKSPQSKVSKYAAQLNRLARRRLCLTGTPMPHSPLDLYGQYRFLNPAIFGSSWFRFRHRYAEYRNATIPQMVTGYQRQEELQEKMASIAFRVDSSVLDLPPFMHHVRPVELGAKARRHYDELEREFLTELQAGVVTVANALTKSLRLRQVTSGYLMADDSDEVQRLDDAKQAALADLLDGLDQHEPVVVFCQFRHDLVRICETAQKMGRSYGEISGTTKDLTDHGTMIDDIDVLGVQIQAGGVGIDLTRAAYVVYYSHPWSLGDYQQSLARVHRPGQKRTVHYYHLVAANTVDEVVRKSLEQKKDVVQSVLSIFQRERL